jgi:hypothetical protein
MQIRKSSNLPEIFVTYVVKEFFENQGMKTVNPRYNGHVRFQRFCRYNESAIVTIYRHYEFSQISAVIF